MTTLTIVQNAMALCSLAPPAAAYASTDDIVRQMLRLLYVEGRDLLKRHDWNILTTVTTFTCGASNAQSSHPPSAFERFAKGSQIWDADNKRPLTGPIEADAWSEAIIRDASTAPMYWRIIGGVLNIDPPVIGANLRYEYISNKWIKQAGTTLATALAGDTGTTLATALAGDTDTFLFPEHLIELGLVWRFKHAKGLDYAEDMRTHEIYLQDAISSDRGTRRIMPTSGMSTPSAAFRRTYQGTIDY